MARFLICSKYYKDNRRMRRHMREFHNPKYICKYCNKRVIRMKPHLKRCKSYISKEFNNKKINKKKPNKKYQKQNPNNKIGHFRNNIMKKLVSNNSINIPKTNFIYFKDCELGKVYFGIFIIE